MCPCPPKAADILLLLIGHSGRLVDKDTVMKEIWPDTFVEESRLASNISLLRRILTEGRDGKSYIETVPKRGYRFVARVELLDPQAALPVTLREPPKGAAAAPESKPKGTYRTALFAACVAAALLCAIVALNPAGLRDRLAEYVAGNKVDSLAVLPLENLSGDPSQDYFADGMTDVLITDLAKIHSLRVVSRTSAMQYKGAHKPLPQIARELGVDAIVEGTVLRSGTRMRVTAQLVRAAHERHLWAETYERDVADSMSLQGEIAQAIAGRVRAEVTPAERGQLSAATHIDPEVYDLYLKGLYYWNKRDPEGLKKSMDYFQQAVKKDPQFALGYVGLADTYNVAVDSFLIPPAEALARSRDASLQALQIDDNLAEAHAALAFVYFELDWDWPVAEREFRRAIELSSGYATAHQWYSLYLAAMGRCQESAGEFRRAEQLDPLSLIIRLDGGAVYFWCRQFDQAYEEFRQVIDMSPGYSKAHIYISGSYAIKGMFDEALAEFKKGNDLEGGGALPMRVYEAWLDAMAGKQQEARGILDELIKSPALSYLDPFFMAAIYGSLGDRDVAFGYLDKAYQQRTYRMVYLKVEPHLDALRADPRFVDLLQRMKLT